MKNILMILLGAGTLGAAWFLIKRKQLMDDPLFTEAAIAARAKAGTIIPSTAAKAITSYIPAPLNAQVWYDVESQVQAEVNKLIEPSDNWLSEKIREGAIKATTKKIIDERLNK